MQKIVLFFACLSCACDGKRLLPVSNPASAFQAHGAAGALSKARGASAKMEDLEALAEELNPVIGFWDPLNLAEADFWEQGNDATVGFLRHAELKHGRVAMAAFVGFCVQSNDIVFPWKLTGDISFSDIAAAGGPPEQWDALPTAAKIQILLFIGFLEVWSENSGALEKDGNAHYMRGGVPGKFPGFNGNSESGQWIQQGTVPHPTLNLYDPFGLNSERSREELDKSLLAEINNGRLAQIGIFGMLSASKGLIVPGLDALDLKQYDGEIMAPFGASDDTLPFMDELLKVKDQLAFPLVGA
jgi:hypothetical protein